MPRKRATDAPAPITKPNSTRLPAATPEHPEAYFERIYGDHLDAYRELLQRRPFDRPIAGKWLSWLAAMYGEGTAEDRIAILIEALKVRSFTNGELMTAAKWIESNCRRFPT